MRTILPDTPVTSKIQLFAIDFMASGSDNSVSIGVQDPLRQYRVYGGGRSRRRLPKGVYALMERAQFADIANSKEQSSPKAQCLEVLQGARATVAVVESAQFRRMHTQRMTLSEARQHAKYAARQLRKQLDDWAIAEAEFDRRMDSVE